MPKINMYEKDQTGMPSTGRLSIDFERDRNYVQCEIVRIEKEKVASFDTPWTEDGVTGVAITFTDRSDVNRFIASLREARDKSFGKDQ